MNSRWADRRLARLRESLKVLHDSWEQFATATDGLADALLTTSSLVPAQLQFGYLDWDTLVELVDPDAPELVTPPKVAIWLKQCQTFQEAIQWLVCAFDEYEVVVHPLPTAADFWLGFLDGRIRFRSHRLEAPFGLSDPFLVQSPYESGEVIGWRYAQVREGLRQLLLCCSVDVGWMSTLA